jgi:hypothetical protein
MDPTFTVSELVTAVGPFCRTDPPYWTGLVGTLTIQGSLVPLPAARQGTGVRRRFPLIEVQIAAVLFRLAAKGMHQTVLGGVSYTLRNGLGIGELSPPDPKTKFREHWDAAAFNGESMWLFINPPHRLANRGFGSNELSWVQFRLGENADRTWRYGGNDAVTFTIQLHKIFREMELPLISTAAGDDVP